MAEKPEIWSEEYSQYQLEKQIREQMELHGWATAVSVANPVDILIMLEEEYDDINEFPATTSLKRVM
jgi:hypothetical protein